MPSSLRGCGTAVVGSRIHVIGGVSAESHYVYDTGFDTWHILPSIPYQVTSELVCMTAPALGYIVCAPGII